MIWFPGEVYYFVHMLIQGMRYVLSEIYEAQIILGYIPGNLDYTRVYSRQPRLYPGIFQANPDYSRVYSRLTQIIPGYIPG